MINKYKIIKMSAIVLVSVVVLAVTIIGFYDVSNTATFRCPPYGCECLFGVSPEEFMNTDLELFKIAGDLRKKASIDNNGWLALQISGIQRQLLLKSEYFSPFAEIESDPRFELNADMTILTTYMSYEEYIDDRYYKELAIKQYLILLKISATKMFSDIKVEKVFVECIEKDPDTGKIYYTFTYGDLTEEPLT